MKIAEYNAIIHGKKRSMYGNVRTAYNGLMYDSKHEAHIAAQFDTLRNATKPSERVVKVVTQVKFRCVVNGMLVCTYIADFHVTYADGHEEIVDAKSEATRQNKVYKIKKKLVKALYGFDIIEK